MTWDAIAGRLILFAVLLLGNACAASADKEIKAELDQDFQLQIGESALIVTEGLELGFQGVTSDSRCGKGEVCIREGDATVRIWMRLADGTRDEIELHTEAKRPSAVVFAGHTIRLVALHPLPLSGEVIEQSKYVATIRVLPGVSGSDAIF